MRNALTAATLLGAFAVAHAAKLPLYDSFSSDDLDRTKWNESEAWRRVEGGRVQLGRWVLGGTASDAGATLESWPLNVADGGAPKGVQAKITVTEIESSEFCAANPLPSYPRARVIASYFNVRPGGPAPNDRTGDILAQITIGRASDSTDAPGVMRVEGAVVECTVADCNSASIVRKAVSLGTAQVLEPVVVRIDWVKADNVFRFSRDGGTPVAARYSDADSTAPSLRFTNLSVRNQVPNCVTGPRVRAGLAADFDDVRYNP